MRAECSGRSAGSLLAIGLGVIAASGGAAPAASVDDIPQIIACEEHDALFMLGWVHAQDRFFQVELVRPNGKVAAAQEVELSGTRGASFRVGDVVPGFKGSCVIPSGATALVQGRNADGTGTPIYGPLSSSGGSDLLPGIRRDKKDGVTSEMLLLNPNQFPLNLAVYCNSETNEEVGGEKRFNIPAHGRKGFASRGPDNQNCVVVNNSGAGRVVVGVRTDFEGSGDYKYTPGVLTEDFDGRDVLMPLLPSVPGGSYSTRVHLQNLGPATEASYRVRNNRGKSGVPLTVAMLERAGDIFPLPEPQDAPSTLHVHFGGPGAAFASVDGSTTFRRTAGDQFSTSIPGYTTANSSSETAVVLGFDYPAGATLTYRAMNPGKKKTTIRVTIGRLDGTVVSAKISQLKKKHKLKKYATLEIPIPASEQGNDLYVRTEVLKKGPVVTYVEVLHSNGRLTYFPGQNER